MAEVELKVVRESMIHRGLCRRLTNHRVNRIRRMFKWAVENALVSPVILHGLQAVAPLKRGRCEAPDHDPIRPLPEDLFNRTLTHLPPNIAAMAKLQWHTGMRPGEVVVMRPMDIDRGNPVWEYRPASHKTQHHGHERIIPLGPKAQAVLEPLLHGDLKAYLFSPQHRMAELRRQQRATRQTPMKPSQLARGPKRDPRKRPGDRYTTNSYAHAIAAGRCKAGVDVWGPNRLRHSAATRLRKEFGLDAARIVLGHRSAEVTTIYAEADRQKAIDAMATGG